MPTPLAPPDIKTLVDQEVKKQGLDIDLDVSGVDCDQQKRTLTLNLVVNAIKLRSEAATDKPVSILVENGELSSDELKKLGLVTKDVVLSVDAVDQAAGAGPKVTINLSAKERKTLSLKPVAGGNFKVRLDVSFRGKKCIQGTEVTGSPGKIIKFTLKAFTPSSATCEMKL